MKNTPKKKETSWNTVTTWYDTLLETDTDTYQAKVLTPNITRLMQIKKGDRVLDVACGQGYFSRLLHEQGAKVVGVDIGKDLIAQAKLRSDSNITYYITPSHILTPIKTNTIDKAVIVLAIQNIEKVLETISEIKRVLTKEGSCYIVLNHPAFRIPQASDWVYDDEKKLQSRKIDGYMNERTIKIDMTPGEKNLKKKLYTVSFHRPLQWYMKIFSKYGFAITRLEEWISHKESGNGPRKIAEDAARKEFPMFLCVELQSKL